MQGWVSFHRKIEEWEWYDDANTFRLFFHLVLKANHKDKKWQGVEIKKGQLVTSSEKLAIELKLSRQQIRTSLDKLKTTKELTVKSTNRFILVTVENYSAYQNVEGRATNNPTIKQPTDNQQITTTNNVNNENHKKTCYYEQFFEECWSEYPNKKGKGKISDSKKKEAYELGEEFKRCISRYVDYVEKETWLKYQNGSTFWNSGYKDYLDSNYKEIPLTKNIPTINKNLGKRESMWSD